MQRAHLGLSLQVDGVKQELKDALQSSSKELYKQLNDALHSSSKELYKQLLKSGAGWVRPSACQWLRNACVLLAPLLDQHALLQQQRQAC
jgi:hypothetical protein